MDRPDQDRSDDSLNLKQVALALGVHYMTAYRYVRQGRLPAERVGTEWRVPAEVVANFEQTRQDGSAPTAAQSDIPWAERLVPSLETGDEPTAWRLIEDVLAAGHDLAYCYLDVLAPAMAEVTERAVNRGATAAQPAVATIVTQRLVARLGPRFRRPGRTRGTVVLGAPEGEHHLLPLSMLADLIRVQGFGVLEVGTNVAPEAFAEAAQNAERLLTIALGITTIDRLDAAKSTIAALRAAVPQTPIIVGGQAVLNSDVAGLLDADGWAPDGRAAVEAVEALDRRSKNTPTGSQHTG